MKKCSLFVWFWMLLAGAYGQYADLPQTSDMNLIPPAPEAASLIRFVDYPVSYCTGVPEITVPVYEVKSRQLSVPVALAYHASGIKVADIASSVGLGWALEAGGVISKVVHGEVDLAAPSFDMRDEEVVRTSKDYRYLKQVMGRMKEAALDRYYYNFCGISGSFILQPDGTIVQIPETDNKIEQIEKLSDSPVCPDKDFKITTPDGTSYYFHTKELLIAAAGVREAVSSWYLDKIVSFDRTDSIEFVYQDFYGFDLDIKSTIQKASVSYNRENPPKPRYLTEINTTTHRYLHCRLLAEIRFGGNKVVFTYAGNRTDQGLKQRLTSVKVYNGELLKTVTLQNTVYFGDGRMKLSAVSFADRNGREIDRYGFRYINESSALRGNGYAQDMFGYYNGKNNTSLSYLDPASGEYDRSRDYSFSSARIYTLEKIERLTGGYTTFTYEANVHPKPSGIDLNIGLRIARIDDHQSNGQVVKTRSYAYENSTPTNRIEKDERNYCIQIGYYAGFTNENIRQVNYYYPFSVTPGVSLEETKIYYGKVTETITGPQGGDTIKTVYEYDRDNFQNPSATPRYAPYENPDQIGMESPLRRFQLNLITDYAEESNWAYNTLLKKTVYKRENGIETPAEVVTYQYKKYNVRELQVALFVRGIIYMDNESSSLYDGPHDDINDFYFFNVYVKTGCNKLKSVTTDRYFGEQKVTETLAYDYNRLDFPPRPGDNSEMRLQTYTAGGKTYVRRYYYPSDYTSSPYPEMWAANNSTAVIKEELQTEGSHKAELETAFSRFTAGNRSFIKPGLGISRLDGTETARQTIHQYDAYGNPVYVSVTGEPNTCYLWGYNGTYPVAEIRNATYEAVVTAMGGETIVRALGAAVTLSQADLNRLNGLRSALPGAQVSTYTYLPLVGVLTQTDPSGRTTTYTYDGAGRLQRVTDDAGNPVSEYEYLIKGK